MLPGETIPLDAVGYKGGRSVGVITGLGGLAWQSSNDRVARPAGPAVTAGEIGQALVTARRDALTSRPAEVRVAGAIGEDLVAEPRRLRIRVGESVRVGTDVIVSRGGTDLSRQVTVYPALKDVVRYDAATRCLVGVAPGTTPVSFIWGKSLTDMFVEVVAGGVLEGQVVVEPSSVILAAGQAIRPRVFVVGKDGFRHDQTEAATYLKPHKEDKNVSPWQMVRFVHDNTGLKALYRYGGTVDLIKRLIAAGFPVVIEKGFQPAGEDWMGHYLLVMGYDDSQQRFLAYDSYLGNGSGNGLPHPYSIFDENWRHFNRVFIVVYEPSREMELRNALGGYADPAYGYQIALETARAEVAQNNSDKWAWFNMGTAYTLLNEYENAAIAYDQAFQLQLPWRMLWYQFGPYEAYFRTGRFEDVLLLADTNRNITPYVEETYYWKGVVYAAQGDAQAALRELDRALYYNKNFVPAQEAKAQVEAGTFQVAAAR